ncbi:putative type VI secretion system effector [Massilia timonae]|uniref:putative type VI secretion system effector n=1 Tax=Massilia timonae TaxID=47229 RepID=UPI0028D4F13D|nr:putative type VI secretion system effector [Massilia timonae]
MEYRVISGLVSDLKTAKRQEDILFSEMGKNIVGMAAISAAAIGSATSSTVLINSNSATEIEMEFFTCVVDKMRLTGVFHQVEFRDGDYLEFVVTVADDVGKVHCVRDPERRLIWTHPYQVRGHIAQGRYDLIFSLILSIICTALFWYMSFYGLEEMPPVPATYVVSVLLPAFVLTFVICSAIRLRVYKFSQRATLIFRAFGFENPEYVNLPKNHSRADANHCRGTQFESVVGVPWRHRY